MKIAYLESEDLFTSNGFFKIWNFFLGKIFPIFGQYFVPTLVMGWKLQAYQKCWIDCILSLSISISWKVLTEDAESVGFFKMLLMKWHENKSCLIRFDCSHIENQGRKIINFFGISRIQIRTKIRLDRKRPELDYILLIRRRSYFGFLKRFFDLSAMQNF